MERENCPHFNPDGMGTSDWMTCGYHLSECGGACKVAKPGNLTEAEILRLAASGWTLEEIADAFPLPLDEVLNVLPDDDDETEED